MPKKKENVQQHNTNLLLIILVVSLITNVVVLSLLARPASTANPACAEVYKNIVPGN